MLSSLASPQTQNKFDIHNSPENVQSLTNQNPPKVAGALEINFSMLFSEPRIPTKLYIIIVYSVKQKHGKL